MSDKDLDIDGILDSKKDAPEESKPKSSSAGDEIDALLASLKSGSKRKPAPKEEIGEQEASEKEPAAEDTERAESAEKESVNSDTDETPEKSGDEEVDMEQAEEKGSADKTDKTDKTAKADKNGGELKENFGKKAADDTKEDIPEKKPVKKSERKNAPSGKGGGKKSSRKRKKKKKKSKVRFNGSIFGGMIIVTIILTVSLLLAVGGITMGMEFYGIGKSENKISFNIPEGSSNEDIADLLFENGIITNKDLFLLTIRFMKPPTIYPGDITLQPSMPYSDIVDKMAVQRERYETVTITFPEGEYLIDIAAQLEENGVCTADDFLFEFNRDLGYDFEGYLRDVDNVFYAREGYFFPDTYEFYVNDTAFNISKIIRDHYETKITPSMYKKMNDMGLSLNETITLASIVQMESASFEEMPNVASVFLNRMKDPDTFPMLESDTTYKYIDQVIKKMAGNDDTVKHYTEYYDTYAIDGLPSGPICNPGIEAINAVLDASETDYYYFCNNLETGETFYAETLEEHEENLVKAGLVNAVDN